ncbi:PI-PLC domain-containing protein [Psychroserpens ponticola]|uniref:Uncharacterized protein n=1 Tax=Psychroserpens ponticola TaxID=2932268 RepID=A0ABY7S1X1_9FLAO|nr:hypothetical protein [Psychroserpens ponticola]WCO03005.1 hypothetical protein MUN68_005810 [Psychroserpens ponticola]
MIIGDNRKKLVKIVLGVLLLLVVYKLNPYRIQFIGHYDKIWAHRVNSTEKLESAVDYFKGVELDLVFDSVTNKLDVNHPPVKSIGLNFQTYLSKIIITEKPYLWLDIKNLNHETAEDIYSRLTNLVENYKYPKEKILVETRYPEALFKFSQYGFMTSYYLDYKIENLKGDAAKNEASKISSILKNQPEIGISSSYHGYDFMTEFFPNKTKYIWVLTPRFHSDFFKIRRMLDDQTVSVVLVRYNASEGNR